MCSSTGGVGPGTRSAGAFTPESSRLAATPPVELHHCIPTHTQPTVTHPLAPEEGDLEEALLVELSEKLAFSALGAGSWAAFSDRLWDVLDAPGEPPVAVVIESADRLLRRSLHTFVRCVHNLVSLTEAVGLSDEHADRQVEYFFVGDWKASDHLASA